MLRQDWEYPKRELKDKSLDYWKTNCVEKMKQFIVLRPKMYSYLKEGGYFDKNQRVNTKSTIKPRTKFEEYETV